MKRRFARSVNRIKTIGRTNFALTEDWIAGAAVEVR